MVAATDSQALLRRIAAHDRFGARDLNDWIFEHLAPEPGDRILDLGCGTGKQAVPLAERVGPEGRVVAVDVARAALDLLLAQAAAAGVEGRIDVLERNLDSLDGALEPASFHRALGSYSLYYARDPQRLIAAVHAALRPDGVLFFCGPSRANNQELRTLHFSLEGQTPPDSDFATEFMQRTGLGAARERFARVDVFTFENPLRFDSADALMTYWRSYGLYRSELEEAFRAAAERHFAAHAFFQTVKRVVGVRAAK